MNWEEACQILGIPVTATQKEIHAQYIYKAQLLHPDKTAGLPETVRQKAEDELKRINAAYNVLKDIQGSPADIAPRLNINPLKICFKDIAPGEKKTATAQISNAGGPYTRFWVDDAPSPWLNVVEAKSTTDEPLPLEITLEATGISTIGAKEQCSLPVRLENEKTKTRDEAVIEVELQMAPQERHFLSNVFGPVLKNPFKRTVTTPEKAPQWMVWLKSAILITVGLVAGLILNNITGTFIPLPLLLGASIILSIEKWHRELASKYKLIGAVYKLGLNLSILALIGLIVWTGIQISSGELHTSNAVNGLLLVFQIVVLGFAGKVLSNNSWRRPKLMPTFFLGAFILVILATVDIGPLAPYKEPAIDFFSRVIEQIRSFIESA